MKIKNLMDKLNKILDEKITGKQLIIILVSWIIINIILRMIYLGIK